MATFSDYCQYNVLLAFSCCLLSNLGFLILLLSSFSYILLSNTTIQHICNHNSICYQVIATFLSSLGCAPSLTLPLRHCSNHCISAVITAPLRRSFRTFQAKLARSRKSISKISPVLVRRQIAPELFLEHPCLTTGRQSPLANASSPSHNFIVICCLETTSLAQDSCTYNTWDTRPC